MVSPFGIEPYSTPELGMAKYFVSFTSVPKPHPGLQSYHGIWEPGKGLVKVTGNSAPFDEDQTASEARLLYDRIKRQLIGVYGQPEVQEFVSDQAWADENDFCMSLSQNERFHSCIWDRSQSALPEGLESILLMVSSADGFQMSDVTLCYTFTGGDDGSAADALGLDSL